MRKGKESIREIIDKYLKGPCESEEQEIVVFFKNTDLKKSEF